MDYKIDSQDTSNLDAVWALGGFTSLGTEILRRPLSFSDQSRTIPKPSEQPLCLRHAEIARLGLYWRSDPLDS